MRASSFFAWQFQGIHLGKLHLQGGGRGNRHREMVQSNEGIGFIQPDDGVQDVLSISVRWSAPACRVWLRGRRSRTKFNLIVSAAKAAQKFCEFDG